jgi:hypothetical protein
VQCKTPPHNANKMDIILKDIAFALARAAVATLLSRELYSFTVPGMLLFSFSVYTVVTRDPLRDSLPPRMGVAEVLGVLRGEKRRRGRREEVVRLSVFGKDVFWVSRANVMWDLVASGGVAPLYYGKGLVLMAGDKDKGSIEKVLFLEANEADVGFCAVEFGNNV